MFFLYSNAPVAPEIIPRGTTGKFTSNHSFESEYEI